MLEQVIEDILAETLPHSNLHSIVSEAQEGRPLAERMYNLALRSEGGYMPTDDELREIMYDTDYVELLNDVGMNVSFHRALGLLHIKDRHDWETVELAEIAGAYEAVRRWNTFGGDFADPNGPRIGLIGDKQYVEQVAMMLQSAV